MLKPALKIAMWNLIGKTLWNSENRCPYNLLKVSHKNFFKKKKKRKKTKTLTSVISLWLAGSTIRSIDWEFPMLSAQVNSMNDNKYLSCPRGAINFPSNIEHTIHSHTDNNNTSAFCLFVNEGPLSTCLSTCFQCFILQLYNTGMDTFSTTCSK